MVNLILSPILDSAAILEKLKQNYSTDSKHLLIVPDNFTLAYEKAGLEYLGILGAFDFEVTDFESLADRFLDKKALRLLDKQSGVMLLRKIIEDNKAELRCFKGATNLIGFAEEMFDAIMKIRESGVEVDSLISVAENDDNLSIKLKNKTYDIALLYKKYVEAIQNGCIDGTSKLKLFAKLIPDSKISEYNVYISDYTFFTKSMYDVIQQLMSTAKSFNICIINSEAANSYIYPNSIKDKILNLASLASERVCVTKYVPKLMGDFGEIQEKLFSYDKITSVRSHNNIEIHMASNIHNEVKIVARQINQLIKNGARYKDISIVCCDISKYEDEIKKVFSDYDISYYCDLKAKLLNQAITNLLLNAIKVVFSHYKQDEIRPFVKSPLLGIDQEEIFIFENFILEYGIDYNKFKEPFEKKEAMDENQYNISEKVRIRIIKALSYINEEAETISDIVKSLKIFLDKNNLQDENEKLASIQNEKGFVVESKITSQCFDIINKILDQADAIMGDTKSSLKTFYNILQSVIASSEISCVPIYVDCVFVGDEGSSKFEPCDYVFVIGASEGNLPKQSVDSGIIADREIEAWKKCDIKIEPDTKTRNRQQKLNTLLTMLKAHKKLIISYPSINSINEIQYPSETLESLEKICDIKCDYIEDLGNDFTKEQLYANVSARKNVLEEFLLLIREIRDNNLILDNKVQSVLNCLYSYVCAKYTKENVDKILQGGNNLTIKLDKKYDFVWNKNYTSPSQIEKYFKCPFQHFIDYFLKAQRRAVANLEVSDIGTILHAIMEKYFSRKDSCDINNEEIDIRVRSIFDEIAEEEIKLQIILAQPDGNVAKENICQRASFLIKELVKKMQCTKFRPIACEKKFGFNSEDSLNSVQIHAKNRVINIKGVIDRVDKIINSNDSRFFVIDYKSKGSINFKPGNILFGDRVQLPIYLMAVMKSKSLTPAGMFYMLMPDRFEKKDSSKAKSRYKYIGYVSANQQNLDSIDKYLSNGDTKSSNLYEIGVSKDGDITGNILSEEDFNNCITYVRNLISKAVDEIDEGYIAPKPLFESFDNMQSGPCEYCKYKTICGITDKPENRRLIDKFSIQDMKNLIGEKDNE